MFQWGDGRAFDRVSGIHGDVRPAAAFLPTGRLPPARVSGIRGGLGLSATFLLIRPRLPASPSGIHGQRRPDVRKLPRTAPGAVFSRGEGPDGAVRVRNPRGSGPAVRNPRRRASCRRVSPDRAAAARLGVGNSRWTRPFGHLSPDKVVAAHPLFNVAQA